jgi:hypothetical protein
VGHPQPADVAGGDSSGADPSFHDFEVEHDFPSLGPKAMLLNVRRFPPDSKHPELILLAIEDITAHIQAAGAVQTPEVRYRR